MTPRDLINSRVLALCCLGFLILVLTACSAGSGPGRPLPEPPPIDDCGLTESLVDGVCQAFGLRSDERIRTPFLEYGVAVSLEAVIVRPLAGDRFPTVIVHHGSTGNGSDPARFTETFTSRPVARFFVERGWQVVFPQRRGRGQSDGLYDEGFTPDRSGYACSADLALAGAERALDDIDVITDWARQRADVDTTRMLIGGVSRGGILSVAFLARRPDVYLGAVNFVGGWLAEGCGDHLTVNRNLFVRGASVSLPTLWLYGANDAFYSLSYGRSLFQRYTEAGGLGEFRELFRAPGLNGHFIVNDPDLWSAPVAAYLAQLH
jgi:dienelactone hydrolase